MEYLTHPLALGVAIVVGDVVAWRLIRTEHRQARIIMRVLIFALLSLVLFIGDISPFRGGSLSDQSWHRFLAQGLQIIWWFLGARVLTIVLDALFLPQAWRGERLFQDVLGALIFVAAAVAASAYVLELPVSGMLATSGALAIVVGLAVQSTLSDVFSGLVLNATQPYHLGEWVSIDGIEGKVVEINWRATHLLSAQGNVVVIPNNTTARAKIINSSRPSELHGISVCIEVTPEARPMAVIQALERALKGCQLALPKPAPSVLVRHAYTNSIEYEMTCYVETMADKPAATNQLFDLAHRHLSSAGIALRSLGVPFTTPSALDRPARLLASVGIFQAMDIDELVQLSQRLSRHEYGPRQLVVSNAEVTDYLLMVDSGVLSVFSSVDDKRIEAARLGPGDSLGEPGVLAGIAMNATVETVTDAVLYRLDKEDLTPILQARPEVGSQMCQLLSQRRESSHTIASIEPPPSSKTGILQWLHDKMRSVHQLGSSRQQ